MVTLKFHHLAGALTATVMLASAGTLPALAASNSGTYTVQAGDTFYKIAVKNQVPLSSLEAANSQITDYTNIYPGEVLNLPTASYTVKAGDTLYLISQSLGVSMSQLEAANPQIANFNDVYPGEIINLPSASAVASTTPQVSSNTPSRQSIVNFAKSLVGTPYEWGGLSPKTGFDCSGFTEYVFGHFGITLMRESHDQATQGTAVSRNALLPGDLLFFKDTDSSASLYANQVTHVGIYLGNGDMIESSSTNNKGVIIVANVFSNPYYIAHYYGARDVIH